MAKTDIYDLTVTESSDVTTFSPNTITLLLQVKLSIGFCLVLGLVGICGNSLVLHVALKRKNSNKKSLQNPFLINLTIVDLLASVMMVVTYSLKVLVPASFQSYPICVIVTGGALVWLMMLTSPVALIVLTLERYIMVAYPVLHKNSNTSKVTVCAILVSWVCPTTWNIVFMTTSTRVIDGECIYQGVWPSPAVALLNGWGGLIISYILPMLIFVFCYSHMLLILRKHRGRAVQPQGQPAFVTSAVVNITVTLLLVCICFILLWSPSQIYWIFYMAGQVDGAVQTDPVNMVVTVLTFTNSVINPFIYVFRIKEFQTEVLALLVRKKSNNDSSTVSNTGTEL